MLLWDLKGMKPSEKKDSLNINNYIYQINLAGCLFAARMPQA